MNKFPPKRVKNLATPSFIFIFVFSSFTGELYSQSVRGNDRSIARMFPEHVERRFLDPEYSFDEYFQLGSRRKVGPIKNQLAWVKKCAATLERACWQNCVCFSSSLSLTHVPLFSYPLLCDVCLSLRLTLFVACTPGKLWVSAFFSIFFFKLIRTFWFWIAKAGE